MTTLNPTDDTINCPQCGELAKAAHLVEGIEVDTRTYRCPKCEFVFNTNERIIPGTIKSPSEQNKIYSYNFESHEFSILSALNELKSILNSIYDAAEYDILCNAEIVFSIGLKGNIINHTIKIETMHGNFQTIGVKNTVSYELEKIFETISSHLK